MNTQSYSGWYLGSHMISFGRWVIETEVQIADKKITVYFGSDCLNSPLNQDMQEGCFFCFKLPSHLYQFNLFVWKMASQPSQNVTHLWGWGLTSPKILSLEGLTSLWHITLGALECPNALEFWSMGKL